MLVICNGMIRSGSTLQYNIVKSILEETGNAQGHGYLEAGEQRAELSDLIAYSESNSWHYFKTHEIDEEVRLSIENNRLFVIYIDRDLYDVGASAKFKWNLKEDELVESLIRAVGERNRLQGFSRLLRQKYESVISNTSHCGIEIVDFLGLNISADRIVEIVENSRRAGSQQKQSYATSFSSLVFGLANVLQLGFLARRCGIPNRFIKGIKSTIAPWNTESLYHPGHQSPWQGESGAWKDILSTSEVEKIERSISFPENESTASFGH